MSDSDEQFDVAISGSALTYPMQCSALRKNGYVMMKGHPCKIVDMSTSKTGKHGHAKVNMTGINIFDGKKYEDMSPSTHNMEVPVVKRVEYSLLDINEEGFLTLMDAEGDTREDVHCNANPDLLTEMKKRMDADENLSYCIKSNGQRNACCY